MTITLVNFSKINDMARDILNILINNNTKDNLKMIFFKEKAYILFKIKIHIMKGTGFKMNVTDLEKNKVKMTIKHGNMRVIFQKVKGKEKESSLLIKSMKLKGIMKMIFPKMSSLHINNKNFRIINMKAI